MKHILFVDDHMMIGQSLAYLMREIDDEIDVHAVDSVQHALTSMKDGQSYDLILLDYDMPGINGLQGLKLIKQSNPDQIVAMISGLSDTYLVRTALRHGALGWVHKSISGKSLAQAIHLICDGVEFIPNDIRQALKEHSAKWADISDKEYDIAELMCEGHSDKVIADMLDLSPHTIRTHVKSIFKKANVDNRTKFALKFRELEA